jgi:hypothetical protein
MPSVPIKLIRADGSMTPSTPALVDSGCDETSFPVAWAKNLGIDFNQCATFSGITAAGQDDPNDPDAPRKWNPGVDAIVMGRKIHLEAIFRPGLPIVLLGREDFFDKFKAITIDQPNKTFRLEWKDP